MAYEYHVHAGSGAYYMEHGTFLEARADAIDAARMFGRSCLEACGPISQQVYWSICYGADGSAIAPAEVR